MHDRHLRAAATQPVTAQAGHDDGHATPDPDLLVDAGVSRPPQVVEPGASVREVTRVIERMGRSELTPPGRRIRPMTPPDSIPLLRRPLTRCGLIMSRCRPHMRVGMVTTHLHVVSPPGYGTVVTPALAV